MMCTGKTQADQPCRSHAREGSKFCYFHDPASADQRREAQSKGGSGRSRLEAVPVPPCDFDLKDPDQIADMLNVVANRLTSGQMEAKVAYAVGYIASLALRVNDIREDRAWQQQHVAKQDHLEDLGITGEGVELLELPREEVWEIVDRLGQQGLEDLLSRVRKDMRKDKEESSTADPAAAGQAHDDAGNDDDDRMSRESLESLIMEMLFDKYRAGPIPGSEG